MKKATAWAYMGIIFVNVIWGLSFIASKIALNQNFTPFLLALVRFVMASVLLLPVTLASRGRPRFTRHEWLLIFCSALFGITLYFLFEYLGLQHTTAGNASLILSVIPVLTMLAGALLHRQRYPLKYWVGVAFSLLGVYLVVRYGGNESGANPLMGNLLLIGACLCWVCYIEIGNRLVNRHGSLQLSCYQSVLGALTLLPLAFRDLPRLTNSIPLSAWGAALFLGVVCSAVCYILYNQSMARLSPFRTALFINLNPISAVLGGALMLGEQLSPPQVIGGMIVLGSIFYVSRASSRPGFDKTPPSEV